jgi:5-methyltetrahydrofolate--homocysteine methyltransferase
LENFQDIMDAVVAGEANKTKEAVHLALNSGVDTMEIINKGLVAGLDIVGERFQTGEMFVPEMMLSALAAQGGIELATEGSAIGEFKPKATIIMGTVMGDLHDIGKNLVALIWRSRGFRVIDLGIDVSDEEFVNAVREHKPEFVGMSCLMTTTMAGMKNVITALAAARLRDNIKVLVGGAPLNQEYADQIGADGYARDGAAAAVLVERLLNERSD